MAISIKDYRATKILGADDSTLLTVLGGTIGANVVWAAGSTVNVSFAPTSTIGAAVAWATGATVHVDFPTTSTLGAAVTIPTTSSMGVAASWAAGATVNVSWDATSTLGAAVAFPATSTVGAAVSGTVTIGTTNATIPVSFSVSSTVQAVTSLAVSYTSSAVWSSTALAADGGTSGVTADLSTYNKIGAFVEVDSESDVEIQIAHDAATAIWYPDSKVSFTGAGGMVWEVMNTGRFYRFSASTQTTITAAISAKT